MFKKLAILLCTAIFLTACSGDSANDDTAILQMKTYQNDQISIKVPNDWTILEKAGYTSNVPNSTIVGFRNNIKSDIFTANLNINSNTFKESVSASDFALSTNEKNRSSLIAYTEISTSEISINTGGEETTTANIIEFSGKKNPQDPIVIFRQLFTVKENVGYTLTAAHLPDEDESVVKTLEQMLNSFTIK